VPPACTAVPIDEEESRRPSTKGWRSGPAEAILPSGPDLIRGSGADSPPHRIMQILQVSHLWEWCRLRCIPLEAVDGRPSSAADPGLPYRYRVLFAPYGRSGREAEIAAALLAALPEWDECLLWVNAWGIWPSDEDWPRFYALRERHGSRRSLEDAPGHLALGAEAGELEELLVQVMENGWDAVLLPAVGGRGAELRLQLSHDGWAELLAAEPLRVDVSEEAGAGWAGSRGAAVGPAAGG
jgi:hypothetical protein